MYHYEAGSIVLGPVLSGGDALSSAAVHVFPQPRFYQTACTAGRWAGCSGFKEKQISAMQYNLQATESLAKKK